MFPVRGREPAFAGWAIKFDLYWVSSIFVLCPFGVLGVERGHISPHTPCISCTPRQFLAWQDLQPLQWLPICHGKHVSALSNLADDGTDTLHNRLAHLQWPRLGQHGAQDFFVGTGILTMFQARTLEPLKWHEEFLSITPESRPL